MHTYKYFVILLISVILQSQALDKSICTESYTVTEYREQPVQESEYKDMPVKCSGWWDRLRKKQCYEKQWVTETVIREVPVEVVKTRRVCCKGFEQIGKKCIPVCTNICENSKCVAPETCRCNPGYTFFSTYRCVPDCEFCNHGRCVAPNVCECYSGYEQTDEGCIPICETPCDGVCAEPNFCISHHEVEYSTQKSSTSTHQVMDYSEENDSEMNSDSVEENIDDYLSTPTSTISTSTEIISTTTTYMYSSTSDIPCPFGLVLDPSGFCRDPCEIDCHYGTFTDGICICNEGFKNAPNNECVCEPYCENECKNGLCTGNNTCLCDDGYKLNPEDNFVCLDSNKCHCKNGDCTDPDHCNCWNGYKLEHSESNYHRCEPICGDPSNPQGCVNGKCVIPSLCKCDEGFIHGPHDNYTCYPDLDCATCIEQSSLCLPACYTTAATNLQTSTEIVTDTSETTDVTYDNYDYNSDVLLYTPVEENKYRIIWYIIISCGAFIILIAFAVLALKRYNKAIDYDIDRREKSTNNVYFSPSTDAVEVEL